MPAYHSRYVSEEWLSTNEAFPEVCSCAVCPLRTELKGPAPPAEGEDIIDETLMYFRANVLFRNFDVRGGADRTLIYLTLYTVQCLVKCEKIEDKPTALRELKNLATKQFLCPGDAGWPLGGLFPAPKNKTETGALSPLTPLPTSQSLSRDPSCCCSWQINSGRTSSRPATSWACG